MLTVSAAWGTGIFYVAARLGLASPVRLAVMDGVHVYAGLVGAVIIAGKLVRVGFHYRVRGVSGIVQWHRWVSWSLLTLYSGVFLTGVLLLLPIHGRIYENLVETHLLISVWAAVPTTWHVWHYRRLAVPYLSRWLASPRAWRLGAGIALVAVPAAVLVGNSRGITQLPSVMGGSAWSVSALSGDYLTHLAIAPDGAVVAAGDAVYISRDGVVWQQVDLPLASSSTQPGQSQTAAGGSGHQHGPAPPPSLALSLAVGTGGIYLGTADGLYRTSTGAAPLVDLHAPGRQVRDIAVSASAPMMIWATSDAGPLYSADAGQTWSIRAEGIEAPSTSQAITFLGARVFSSDARAVYEWLPDSDTWMRSSVQKQVVGLDPTPDADALYASSALGGAEVYRHDRWTLLSPPGEGAHLHAGHPHAPLHGITEVGSRLYAAGTAFGVPASADGGRTWTDLGGGLGDSAAPGQVIERGGSLWAATTDGLYRLPLTPSQPASLRWWVGLIVAALAGGALAVGVVAFDLRRRRGRARPEPDAAT